MQTFNFANNVSYIISDNTCTLTTTFSLPGFAVPTVIDPETNHESCNYVEMVDRTPKNSEDIFEFIPEQQPSYAHALQLFDNEGRKMQDIIHTLLFF